MTTNRNATEVLTQKHLSILALSANGRTLEEIASLTMTGYSTVRRRVEEAKMLIGADSLPNLIARCVADGAIIRGAGGFMPSIDPTSLE